MGTVEENLRNWEGHDWSKQGEEWSEVWGGSRNQWEGAILPRIRAFVPCDTVLEIACGYGRWSEWLLPNCQQLILVDLLAGAVDGCKARFRDYPQVSCFRNDGRTLPMAADRSIDFVFSFDSLVHCERPELEGYVREIARILRPEGAAFLHHSNMQAVQEARPGTHNLHWRAESVAATTIAEACAATGLRCIGQEIVDWGGVEESDCFSTIARPGSVWDRELVRSLNPHFMAEAHSIRLRANAAARRRG